MYVVVGLHFARRLNENIGAWTHVLAIGQSATTTEEVKSPKKLLA